MDRGKEEMVVGTWERWATTAEGRRRRSLQKRRRILFLFIRNDRLELELEIEIEIRKSEKEAQRAGPTTHMRESEFFFHYCSFYSAL